MLMTHLCHKPVGGGGQDSRSAAAYLPPPQAWAVLSCPDSTPGHGGGTEEGQMSICLRRRDLIAGLGGTAAWPFAARAQQSSKV